jgi:hypothetical protein
MGVNADRSGRRFWIFDFGFPIGSGLRIVCLVVPASIFLSLAPALAAEPDLPIVVEESFEAGSDRWEPFDAAAWKIEAAGENHLFAQVAPSAYQPPHRSPVNIALLKDVSVGDFQLDVKVRSTCRDYGHRDVCLVFAYQDPAHFYYVHLGKQADDHANQIFIVNDAPRTKISTKTTPGTPWDDQWHHVRVARKVADGSIEVYFDDLDEPAMTAADATFAWGRIGLGTFDDTAEFDDLVLRGTVVEGDE